MKKLILALLFISGTLFSQVEIKSPVIPNKVNDDLVLLAGTVDFKFSNIGTWWIPKFKPFGTSTTFTDSTNYVTLNKGLYVFDSIKTDRDLIVKGAVVLDTLRQGKLYYDGLTLTILNSKGDGNIDILANDGSTSFNAPDGYSFTSTNTQFRYEDNIGWGFESDNSGFTVLAGDLSLLTGAQQIKLPSDTATDYDANDVVTINRQSGKITTKSLTTAADDFYTLTLTNSLISATSKIFLNWTGGTESAGRPTIYKATCGSGSATIILLNLTGAGSFNGTVQLDFVIFN